MRALEAIENDPEVASRMSQMLKIVVSRSLQHPDPEWNHTRLVGEDVQGELSGKDLLVLGSSALAASLILGTTRERTKLKLLDGRTVRSGNVPLTYEPVRR